VLAIVSRVLAAIVRCERVTVSKHRTDTSRLHADADCITIEHAAFPRIAIERVTLA
jgi:hypothetical protein